MARRTMSARSHARKFGKNRRRMKRINMPSHHLRGGIRL